VCVALRAPVGNKIIYLGERLMIRHIEELSMSAWPSLQTMLYDGWVMRFANGYTRRSNSVNPIYDSSLKMDEKIQNCEQLYRRKGLPVVFKMTPAVSPENLDGALDQFGYQIEAPTSLQVAQLDGLAISENRVATVSETLSEEWLTDLSRLNNISLRRQPILQQILSSVAAEAGFFSLRHEGQTIACGMGVVQDGFIGLFDIVTDAQYRNRGHGLQLVSDILAWGIEKGARKAYLQVMLNNPPALKLYSKVGFTEVYQYWYRVKS
jgi:N-acetylglutamate synthase